MLSASEFTIPMPTEIVKKEGEFLFRVSDRPYLINRGGQKYLYRAEEWGLIEYDYAADQFSALVDANKTEILPRAPLAVYWLVTAPCNLRCIHCYGNVEELPRENLSEPEQNLVADQIIKSGVMRVTLNGGEPLLRKDTPRIIEKLADNNVSVILGTNGTYLTAAMMSSVRRATRVEISFDSHDEATNNSIRVSRVVTGNAFRESLRAIDLCLSEGVRLTVLTCVNNRNISHLEQIADLLYARGVRHWSVSWTLFAGRARFIYDTLAASNNDQVIATLERIRQKYPDFNIKFSNRSNSSSNNRFSCLVFPNGRMFAEDLALGKKIPFKSLLESPLQESWVDSNYDIKKHFERWTADRVKHF